MTNVFTGYDLFFGQDGVDTPEEFSEVLKQIADKVEECGIIPTRIEIRYDYKIIARVYNAP